ncbi:MAG: Fe-S cluster assembly protein SufD [Spirochaetota bacterium]
MNQTETRRLGAVEDLPEYQKTLGGPDWLAALRTKAFEKFAAVQWPTTQEEEWRRTNLSAFEFESYSIVAPVPGTAAGESDVSEDRAGVVSYRSGVLTACGVRDDVVNQGVVFGSLLDVIGESSEVVAQVRSVLERSVDEADNRLQHWHYAMLRDTAVLYVPANVTVEAPFEVELEFDGDEAVHAPHLVVILERGAQASVVRRLATPSDDEVLVVDASEFVVSDGARLRYVSLQRMNDESLYFCNDRGNVSRDAFVHRTETILGSAVTKSRYVLELSGEGADAVLNGIYFGTDEQHVDLRTVQQHRSRHTTSRAFYRGAVADESHAIYQGLIQVDGTAAGTDAYLTNKSLILGEAARSDSIPSLNINTDDVRCSHGSTTGKLDESQIFYLRCRGYTATEAKQMLVEGFFEDLIVQTPQGIHQEIRDLIMERIPEGD